MNKKYKVTPFTRLLVFLVLFAPIAYIAASYYQGEDGLQNIKEMVGIENPDADQQIEQKQAEIRKLEDRIELLKSDIETLNNNQ